MRIVSVLGAVLLGLGIGSVAILAPLNWSATSSGGGSPVVPVRLPGTASVQIPAQVSTAANTSDSSLGTQSMAAWTGYMSSTLRSLSALAGFDPQTQPYKQANGSPALKSALADGIVPTVPAVAEDSKTIKYLAQPNGTSATTTADARTLETPWSTQVSVAPEMPAPRKQTSSKPNSDEQRQSLVRDLQTQLKRVGCYDGDVNGQWAAPTKKAMASFTDRVNATLPFEQPDFILLTLLQGHKGRACGQNCPTGQTLAENGRCTPNSVLARVDRAKQTEATKREASASAALPGAVKGSDEVKPNARDVDVAGGPSIGTTWRSATPDAAFESATTQTGSFTPPAVAGLTGQSLTRNPVILPGRMAIGAPVAVNPALEQAPVLVKPASRVAAVDTKLDDEAQSVPVTAAKSQLDKPTAQDKRPRVIRPQPRAALDQQQPVVRRAPPPPKYYAPQPAQSSGQSKSRRLVYELFQRPDRN